VKLIEMKHNRTNERTNQIQGQPLVISPFTFQEFTSFIIVYFIPITFNILWYIGFLLCLLLIFLALGFCPFWRYRIPTFGHLFHLAYSSFNLGLLPTASWVLGIPAPFLSGQSSEMPRESHGLPGLFISYLV